MGKKFKILVAEDNAVSAKIAGFALRPIANEIVFASNGEEVIQLFMNEDFDLIFMDILMPRLDGNEATLEIRKIEKETNRSNRIPIIALTANVVSEAVQKCMNSGMDGFIAKPFKLEEVKIVLKQICLLP